MANYYTNDPARFSGGYTTHDPTEPQTAVPEPEAEVAVTAAPSGVRKRFRVRRSDFSSQKSYEFALRAALLNANYAIRPSDDEPVPEFKPDKPKAAAKPKMQVTDTEIKVSGADLAALQRAAELDEVEMLELFITAIESEYP